MKRADLLRVWRTEFEDFISNNLSRWESFTPELRRNALLLTGSVIGNMEHLYKIKDNTSSSERSIIGENIS